jgi:hypothetical protein
LLNFVASAGRSAQHQVERPFSHTASVLALGQLFVGASTWEARPVEQCMEAEPEAANPRIERLHVELVQGQ